jgi:hypothetical protein
MNPSGGGGVTLSTPVQTGPGAHPASCTIGIGLFNGGKWPGHGINYPPHLALRLKNRVQLFLYCVVSLNLPLPFTLRFLINSSCLA